MVTEWESIIVRGEGITLDLLVWRRYRRPAPGIFEIALDANQHLAKYHKESPFLPLGVEVLIPIDHDILGGVPTLKPSVDLFGPR